jgi:N-acyl-D-amino-acid deacylase
MYSRTAIGCLLLFAAAAPSWAEENVPGPKEVRQAIERSLPFLKESGLAWMKQRQCVACHHSAFMIWSHREAARHGIGDAKKIADLSKQSLDLSFGVKQSKLKDNLAKKGGSVEASHLLLGEAAGDAVPSAETATTLTSLMLNAQQADGFWKYEGQSITRSANENDQTTTLWSLFALSFLDKADPSYARSRDLARHWLKNAKPVRESNENLVAWILVANAFGDTQEAQTLVKELIAQQKPDGGWAWMKNRPSDAFATGQSLYALGRMNVTSDEPAVPKAWKFLLSTQQSDGSWKSPTRKANTGFNDIANYWGSAWATIGLARSLPVGDR